MGTTRNANLEALHSALVLACILVAAAVLSVGIFTIGNLRTLWEKKRSLVVAFQYADGIETGSPVWYAGYKVGEVTGIRIAQAPTEHIAITVKIDAQARVRKDSHATIRNLGMMGSKYLELSPGTPDAPELLPGDALQGESPASLSQVIETGAQVAQQLQHMPRIDSIPCANPLRRSDGTARGKH